MNIAIVVLKHGAWTTAEELQHLVASSLAKFKVPARVEFQALLPKSAKGEVLNVAQRRTPAAVVPAVA